MSDVSAEDLSGDFIVDLKSTAERGRCRRDEQPPLNMPSRNGPFVSSKRPSGSTEPVAANAISSAIDRVSRIIWLRKWFQSLAFLNDGRHRQNGTTQSAFNWPRQVLLISFFFLFLFFFFVAPFPSSLIVPSSLAGLYWLFHRRATVNWRPHRAVHPLIQLECTVCFREK